MPSMKLTCHCGAASQTLDLPPLPRSIDGTPLTELTICHCSTCRHSTGQLFASYLTLPEGLEPGLNGLRAWSSLSGQSVRYFCTRCSCHVFIQRDTGWSVATGTIVSEPGELGARFVRHRNVADAGDGGLAPFLKAIDSIELSSDMPMPSSPQTHARTPSATGILPASCACKAVSLLINRPDASSLLPHSHFPDLMVAYRDASPANASDVKWWLCPRSTTDHAEPVDIANATGYLAGTCACQTCRLVSGFEIQSWAFIPEGNIRIRCAAPPAADTATDVSSTEDFQPLATFFADPLHSQRIGNLGSYVSSPGATRNFCAHCGATIFWRGRHGGPSLIDVSAGLLRAESGARAEAEGWLQWWKGRVSFAEEASLGREGAAARRAVALVKGLEDGMRENNA